MPLGITDRLSTCVVIDSLSVPEFRPGARAFQSMVFNMRSRPSGIVNQFWSGREKIIYVDSCITFALFEF